MTELAPYLVIDTNVLRELFGVPQRHEIRDDQTMRLQEEQKKRFAMAERRGCRFFIPYPVVFEMYNGIAHVKDDKLRCRLAEKFTEFVENSFDPASVWVVISHGKRPLLTVEQLRDLCKDFPACFAATRLGLADAVILKEAERLKSQHHLEKRRVHIWTREFDLKKREPDNEPQCWLTAP